ncbi:MAG TPA: exodeoxyribonuclease VII large subunit [Patescibacteria group bacterium]|nr:exodeoxyribonuclease VII large subunit [Patescibacteria group bacterium]
MIGTDPTLTVSEFVAVFNQTVEMMYPSVGIVGELANFKVSKGRWVYFDLKDETSSVRFFGTVNSLPGPLENGLNLEVFGQPRLHPQYGFSVNVRSISVVGEGSLAKAQALLARKLEMEGLFSEARKRPLPYPPSKIGLITSVESAAYADFIKIINHRWGNIQIDMIDCLVQGVDAPAQIVSAIEHLNQVAEPPEALIIIRGGGSADDLAAFSTEQVVRAVAGSRIPTLVAVGHEVDVSLAELAADRRASTPSNAAELLVPDITDESRSLVHMKKQMSQALQNIYSDKKQHAEQIRGILGDMLDNIFIQNLQDLQQKKLILGALDPKRPLSRGYALVKGIDGKLVKTVKAALASDKLTIDLSDGTVMAKVDKGEQG